MSEVIPATVKTHIENLNAKIEVYRLTLNNIAMYDTDSKYGEGICPYGCDCPSIAQKVLLETKINLRNF